MTKGTLMTQRISENRQRPQANEAKVFLISSAAVTGARVIPSQEIDRAFGMPIGKLRHRAGIESVAHAADGEDELTLGARAAEEGLRPGGHAARELDWIIATSETHHNYPSLAAHLHSRLLARENCGALDVGGGCLGLLNALAVAQSLIRSGSAQSVAVVTADVHSRTLTPGRVVGEFGGLFASGNAAHAPVHAGVRGVRYGGSECQLVPEQN
jgi:3-oxoacyl-[acyl-carrier-protein] synthase III